MKEVYREDKRNRKLRRLNNNESEARLEMDDKVRQEIAIMKWCARLHLPIRLSTDSCTAATTLTSFG